MAERRLTKIEARDAGEVCRRFTLSDEAAALPRDGVSPPAFLDALTAAGQFVDAETFLAYALPRREAVWWACLCTREAVGTSPPPLVADAQKANEAWVSDPNDSNRRKAMAAAEAVGLGHPAGATGMAAFTSGGSMAPPGLPDVSPGDHHTSLAVSCAVQMAAALGAPERATEAHRKFIDLGLGVAEGRLAWPGARS